jgi:VRR-NUC domain
VSVRLDLSRRSAAKADWTERQLALFEQGKIPRVGRRTPPREVRTHIAIADMLRKLCRPDWWWSHISSGELRTENTGKLLKAMGLRPGMGDFLFIAPQGQHLWMELKRAGRGRLSDAQLEFAEMCRGRGVPHAVVHGFREAEAQLREWGVLKPEAWRIGR